MNVCVPLICGGGNKGDVQHQIARLINLSVRLFAVTINSVPQGAYWEMTRLRPPGTHAHSGTHTHTHTQADTAHPLSFYPASPMIKQLSRWISAISEGCKHSFSHLFLWTHTHTHAHTHTQISGEGVSRSLLSTPGLRFINRFTS